MKLHLIVGLAVLLFVACMISYALLGPTDNTAKASGPATYPGEPVSGEPIKTASGLMYYDMKVGDGPSPAGPSSTIRINYTGWLRKTGKKFDSSVDHGGPQAWPLGNMIPGWIEGVGSMKVGGKRKLIVPAKLGYAAAGQGEIPPNADLVFDVELLGLE